MARTTFYEWVCEEVDENRDIINCEFSGSLKEALSYKAVSDYECDIALVRNTYEDEDGELIERGYCYFINGVLCPKFDNGYSVPKRFVKEVTLCKKN